MTPGAAGGPAAAPRAASAAAITHVLFDMDGLLLDTESAYTDAQRRVLEAIEPGLGAAFTWELKAKMMGRTSLAAGRVLVDALDLERHLLVHALEVNGGARSRTLGCGLCCAQFGLALRHLFVGGAYEVRIRSSPGGRRDELAQGALRAQVEEPRRALWKF